MKITEKDKKLLLIVGALAIIFCAYFFGYRNISAASKTADKEITKLNKQYGNLKVMKANSDEYASDTTKYNDAYDDTMNCYDSGCSQEYIIMFLNQIEDETGTWLSQAGFSDTEKIYTFGQVNSTNPAKVSAKAYSSDYIGYKTTITLAYSTSYKAMKKTIDYINNYKYKCTIDSMTMAYNSGQDVVSGTMVLTIYTITGTGRDFTGYGNNTLVNGTDNIFNSSIFTPGVAGNVENGNNIISDYDCYLTLQPDKSDVGSLTMGCKNDSDGSSVIKNNSNDFQNVNVHFFKGNNGEYKIQYKVGNITYPAEDYQNGQDFIPGNMLSMLVISSERSDDDDLGGAKVTIVNDTEMKLYIKVVNEDTVNPRFIIAGKTGDVQIFE